MPKRRSPTQAKLPAQQLLILAIARFSEPLAMTSVFPYLPEMIKSFGVAQNEVAKWAGITSASFNIAQSITAVPWGKASDKFGRKSTIIIGLASTLLLFLVWGISTSLPMAITVRALMGCGNGNVGIIRTMVAEMVTEKHLQPRAFSIMPLVWSIGSIFGPAFGGMFVKPAERFPDLFGKSQFFKAYPFALPNFFLAIVFLISMSTALLFLKETLHSRRDERDWGLVMGKRLIRPFRQRRAASRIRRTSFVDGEATAPLLATEVSRKNKKNSKKDGPSSSSSSNPNTATGTTAAAASTKYEPTMREVFTTQTSIGLVAYTFLALHSVAFDQVLPVFLNMPSHPQTPENSHLPFQFTGGFGMGSDRIGVLFACYGITCGLVQFLVFPPLCNRLGVRNCYRLCSVLAPPIYLLTPYTVLFPTAAGRFAALLTLMFLKAFVAIIGFPCMTILLTNSASDLRILGTLNGFATMFSGLGRAGGPAGAGAAFSWGVERGYVITAWWLLALAAAIGAIPAWLLVEGDGPSAGDESSDADDEDGEDGEDENAILSDSDDDDDEDEDDSSSSGSETVKGSSYAERQPAEQAPLLGGSRGERSRSGKDDDNGNPLPSRNGGYDSIV